MISSIAVVFILTFISSIFIEFYWKFYKLSDIPGPFCVPFFSHVHRLLFKEVKDVRNTFKDLGRTYGDFYKSWFGPKLFFVVNKPEYLKVVLNHPDCLEKGSDFRFFRRILKNGIFSAPVDIWKVHRKLLAPTYNQSVLTSQLSTVNKCIGDLIEILKNRDSHSDVLNAVTNCFLDVVSETMFGLQINAQRNNENISHVIESLWKTTISRVLKIWLQPESIFRLSKGYVEFETNLQRFEKTIKNIFDLKLASLDLEAETEDGKNKHFLSYLMRMFLDGKISEEDVLAEIKVLIMAGTDTNSLSVCFVLTLLAMHQQIQDKVYKEISENIKKPEITLEDLTKLKYTECVIKETLRLTPVVLYIFKKSTKSVTLDNFTIPKDSEIVVGIVDVHRDERFWPDPLKFDPDRFLPENASKIYPYSYIPFSAGPRNCLGQKISAFSTKIVVAHIIRSFVVKTSYKKVEEIELVENVTTRPKAGFKLFFEHRNSCGEN